MIAADSWRGLRAGDQIGNLEYLLDEHALAEYREAVGDEGCFPNLMAEDCRAMLIKHRPGAPLTTIWQRLHFLRPPILGRRVQVGAWVREIGVECSRPWVRVAAFAVDEIGTEILRSEATFAVGLTAGRTEPIEVRPEANSQPVNLAGSRAGNGGCLGELHLPARKNMNGYIAVSDLLAGIGRAPDGNGPTSVAAGWLEGLMGSNFGDDFRWGGELSIAYHQAFTAGMELRCDAVVLGQDTDAQSVETRRVAISVQDARDSRLATAEVVVKSPSPRLI